MKKGKITGDVAVLEVLQSTNLGVRTRARTLALQPNPELSYLQLRNRRLEKPQFQQPTLQKQEKHKQTNHWTPNAKTNSRLRDSPVNSATAGSVSFSCSRRHEERQIGKIGSAKASDAANGREGGDEQVEKLEVEASFGENNLELYGVERSTRESTPCSFIRDVDTLGTPCSAVRPTCSSAANQRVRNTMQRVVPTTQEMEEFFAGVELRQQNLFMDKYNFDVVNDSPLPGRYEWVRVDP